MCHISNKRTTDVHTAGFSRITNITHISVAFCYFAKQIYLLKKIFIVNKTFDRIGSTHLKAILLQAIRNKQCPQNQDYRLRFYSNAFQDQEMSRLVALASSVGERILFKPKLDLDTVSSHTISSMFDLNQEIDVSLKKLERRLLLHRFY